MTPAELHAALVEAANQLYERGEDWWPAATKVAARAKTTRREANR